MSIELSLKQREVFKVKKQALLKILLSKNENYKYKRLSLSPIRYAGGKSLAVGHIIENLPPVKRIISPFFGGGSIEIAIAQKLGVKVIACDVDKPLTNYWKFQLKQPEELYQFLKKLKPNRKLIIKSWIYAESGEKMKKSFQSLSWQATFSLTMP